MEYDVVIKLALIGLSIPALADLLLLVVLQLMFIFDEQHRKYLTYVINNPLAYLLWKASNILEWIMAGEVIALLAISLVKLLIKGGL